MLKTTLFLLFSTLTFIGYSQNIQFDQAVPLLNHPNQTNTYFNYPFIALDYNNDSIADLFGSTFGFDENGYLFEGEEMNNFDTLIFDHNHPLKNMDFDQDGDQDIILREALLINQGQDSFSTIPMQFESLEIIVEAADLNADNNTDLIVINNKPFENFIYVYFNNGDQTFSKASLDKGYQHDVVDIGDLDGDGDIDIVSFYNRPGNVAGLLFVNDGNGSFSKRLIRSDETVNTNSVDLEDFDKDGDLDILVHNSYQIIFLENTNNFITPAEAHAISIFSEFRPLFLRTASLNFDEKIDILALGEVDDNFIIFTNSGTGNFDFDNPKQVGSFPGDVSSQAYPNYASNHLHPYDYDFDGKIDILYTDGQSNTSKVYFFKNTTDNTSSNNNLISINNLDVYPNPVKSQLYFQDMYPQFDQYNFTISNAEGKIIISGKSRKESVDVSGLSDGIYHIRLIMDSQPNTVYSSGFIKAQ